MDIAYMVKGFVTVNDKEKQVLYVGISPKRAFDYLKHWNESAKIEIEIWEDGHLVQTIS